MKGRSERSKTPKAGRMQASGWPRYVFLCCALFLLACWASSLSFPVQTGTKSGADPYNRGAVLLTQQKWKQAAAEFQAAIRANPNSSQAYGGLGVALTGMGNQKDAEAAFREAIRLDAKNAQAHYYLGLIAAESQRLEDATSELKAAVELKPDFEPARLALALALEESGQIKGPSENTRQF